MMFVLIAAAYLSTGKKWRMNFSAPAISFTGADTALLKHNRIAKPALLEEGGGFRALLKQPSPDDKLRSAAYADSGKASFDRKSAVAFFKMAIAINKYNVDAWYGLLAAYTALGMEEEAHVTKDEMAMIFGEELFTISKTMERFGNLLDMYNTDGGAFFIEYRSREVKNDALLYETFQLAKALGARKNYSAFSFYAHAAKGSGGGVLAYVAAAPLPGTYREYRAQAKVTLFNGAEKKPRALR